MWGNPIKPQRQLCQLQKVHRAAQQRSKEKQEEAEEAVHGLAEGGEGEGEGEGGGQDALKIFMFLPPLTTNCDTFDVAVK